MPSDHHSHHHHRERSAERDHKHSRHREHSPRRHEAHCDNPNVISYEKWKETNDGDYYD